MTSLASSSDTAKPPVLWLPAALPSSPVPFYDSRRVVEPAVVKWASDCFIDAEPNQQSTTPASGFFAASACDIHCGFQLHGVCQFRGARAGILATVVGSIS